MVLHLSSSHILVVSTEQMAIPHTSGNVWAWKGTQARWRRVDGAVVLQAKGTVWAQAGKLESIDELKRSQSLV